jgi:hypothetical protein
LEEIKNSSVWGVGWIFFHRFLIFLIPDTHSTSEHASKNPNETKISERRNHKFSCTIQRNGNDTAQALSLKRSWKKQRNKMKHSTGHEVTGSSIRLSNKLFKPFDSIQRSQIRPFIEEPLREHHEWRRTWISWCVHLWKRWKKHYEVLGYWIRFLIQFMIETALIDPARWMIPIFKDKILGGKKKESNRISSRTSLNIYFSFCPWQGAKRKKKRAIGYCQEHSWIFFWCYITWCLRTKFPHGPLWMESDKMTWLVCLLKKLSFHGSKNGVVSSESYLEVLHCTPGRTVVSTVTGGW